VSYHQIEVEIVVVSKQVDLVEGEVYQYKDGQLLNCGSLDCILGHVSESSSAVLDHFNGEWAGRTGPHVVRGGSE
jgi:hypothetical protein